MKPWTVVAAVVVAVGGFTSPVTAQTPEELFNEGNAAYEDGSYGGAVHKYDMVLRYGVRDPRVEYNLGNAYYKLGHIGNAILHYERALRMDPTDPDIIANLEFARLRRFDRVDPPDEAVIMRWLRGVQNRVGPDRQAVVVLVLVWIAAGLIGFARRMPENTNIAQSMREVLSRSRFPAIHPPTGVVACRATTAPTAIFTRNSKRT